MKIVVDGLCAGMVKSAQMTAKNISVSPQEVATLDALRVQTGASHSESIRRALAIYGNMILRKKGNFNPRRK